MSNLILKYPLDLRGNSPTNLVKDEVHQIPSEGNRVVIPNYGPFFTQGLIVKNYATGETLTKGDHYKAAQLYQEAVQRTGKEVCAVIVITDPNLNVDQVSITYQVVGDKFQRAVPVIKDLIDDLDIDERAVQWGDLLAVPEAFPPVSHLHDAGDLYGFEYLVASIEQLREAILIGDEAAHQEIIGYIEDREQESIARDDNITQQLYDHASDKTNPHDVTKAQVGLSVVENYPPANQTEAEEGTASNRYMTPLRVAQAITDQVGTAFTQHAADRSNPHEVTKAQVGLSSVANYPVASTAEAQAGTAGNRYMTALRVKEAIDTQVRSDFNTHVADTNNPHDVTKGQVGLSNVANYGMATIAEAQAGTVNNKYVTPLRVKEAIDSQIRPAVESHISNTSNPHGVTKAQVNLGSVADYAPASQTEAQAGAVNNRYMTPLRVAQAIATQVGNAFSLHESNTSNPHSVTKAQVGLSNVTNDAQVKKAGDTMTGPLEIEGSYLEHLKVTRVIDGVAKTADVSLTTTNYDGGTGGSMLFNGMGTYRFNGNVSAQNLPVGLATVQDTYDRTDNTKYMSPSRTNLMVTNFTGGPLEYNANSFLRRNSNNNGWEPYSASALAGAIEPYLSNDGGVRNDYEWSGTATASGGNSCSVYLKRIDIGPFRLIEMQISGYIYSNTDWPTIPTGYRPDRDLGFVANERGPDAGSQASIEVRDNGTINHHENFSGIEYRGVGVWLTVI